MLQAHKLDIGVLKILCIPDIEHTYQWYMNHFIIDKHILQRGIYNILN